MRHLRLRPCVHISRGCQAGCLLKRPLQTRPLHTLRRTSKWVVAQMCGMRGQKHRAWQSFRRQDSRAHEGANHQAPPHTAASAVACAPVLPFP